MSKMLKYQSFLEAMRTPDLSSIPGKKPGEKDYIADVTARARERLGISDETEGDRGSIMRAVGPIMNELSRSNELSRGHEEQLEKLATQVITDLYKPIIDYYNIKLDIKILNGMGVRRFIDNAFAKQKSSEPKSPSQTPIVRARGADFSMLIHEAVKGIWRVLSMSSVPKDPELAKAIENQFGLSDEPDEWRYGPEIASDLRDFVNKNPKVDSYENLREELWKYMIDEKNLPTEEFLSLMKGILSETQEARIKLDKLIDRVIQDIEKRDQYLKDLRAYELEMANYEKKMEEYRKKKEAYDRAKASGISTPKKQEPQVLDYSKMSQRELNDELSKALDSRDFEKVKEISQYLK